MENSGDRVLESMKRSKMQRKEGGAQNRNHVMSIGRCRSEKAIKANHISSSSRSNSSRRN